MNTLNTDRLHKLISEGRWEEAKTLLDSHLNSALTEEERGAIYTKFASIYMQINTELNNAYQESLAQAVDILKKINEKEKELSMKQGQKSIKENIKNLFKKSGK
jgi:hypothetical protein